MRPLLCIFFVQIISCLHKGDILIVNLAYCQDRQPRLPSYPEQNTKRKQKTWKETWMSKQIFASRQKLSYVYTLNDQPSAVDDIGLKQADHKMESLHVMSAQMS